MITLKKNIATPFKMKFHCDWWRWCWILTEWRQLQCAVQQQLITKWERLRDKFIHVNVRKNPFMPAGSRHITTLTLLL